MSPQSTLSITGSRGKLLANDFFRQRQATTRLALVFPGINYNADMPLIYYTTEILRSYGADVLQFRPDYQDPVYRKASPDERLVWMAQDATAGLEAGLAAGTYRQIVLAGKSIGTLSIALLLTRFSSLDRAITLWLTPLLHEGLVVESALKQSGPSFFMAGSADKTFDPAALQQIQKSKGAKAWIAEGADHSLEIPGDPMASLNLLATGMQALSTFMEEALRA